MKKVKIDIPLELYTDNVRKIIERSLHDLDAEPPYIASFLCDPKFTEKDLETALHLLEKAKTETTKQKFIRAELEARRERVLLSFANEKQEPLVGTWKVDDEGGAFYAPFTGRTYASLGYFVSAWMPLPEPYKPEDIKEAPWKNRALGDFMKGANR